MFNPGKALGRTMLGSIFVASGYNELKQPEAVVPAVEPAAEKLLGGKDKLPVPPKTAAQIHGGVMLAAGTLLATGKLKRLSALALIATMVPNTLVGHAFWETSDPEKKRQQQTEALRNAAIVGGLLLQVFDVPPIPKINRGEINLPDVDLAAALPSGKDIDNAKKSVLSALGR